MSRSENKYLFYHNNSLSLNASENNCLVFSGSHPRLWYSRVLLTFPAGATQIFLVVSHTILNLDVLLRILFLDWLYQPFFLQQQINFCPEIRIQH